MTKFEKRLASWKECSPSNISKLFYLKEDGDLKRYTSFPIKKFTKREHNHLEKLAQEIKGADPNNPATLPANLSVRIYMGIKDETFAPSFVITCKKKSYLFDVDYDHPTVGIWHTVISGQGMFWDEEKQGNTIITAGIEALFMQNWLELNDEQVGNAFLGITATKIVPKDGEWSDEDGETTIKGGLNLRKANFYSYSSVDALDIIRYMLEHKDADESGIGILMGAGLTIDLVHPFNFRPIISTKSSGSAAAQAGGGSTYYERSLPCPPFCPNDPPPGPGRK